MLPARSARRLTLATCAGAALAAALACQPKPKPTALPPKEVPHLQGVGDGTGSRGNIYDDAVQVGSNQAKLQYDCGPPHGRNVQGGGVLTAPLSRCEIDTATKTVTFASEVAGECAPFFLQLSDYRGPGTYNTSSITRASFGLAKLRQPSCSYDANLCMEWSREGAHPEASCTIEISSDGGLQYGTNGATVSGTFVCTAFVGPFKGCAGVSAVAGCGINRGSFSIAGCSATSSGPAAPGPPPPKPRARRGR